MGKPIMVAALAAGVLVGGLSAVQATGAQRSADYVCNAPLPPDFHAFDESIWGDRGAWLYAQPASEPLPALNQRRRGPIAIGLDDGGEGTVRVEPRPCAPPEACDPEPCFIKSESYWAEVADTRGARRARIHFCAAYEYFQVVPADVVDGPGDEVLIIRSRGHSAPPTGNEMLIWALGDRRPKQIGLIQVSGRFSSLPFATAGWRATLWVDSTAPKPRPIRLRMRMGSAAGTRVCDSSEIATVRSMRVVRFRRASGKYEVSPR